ncbi:MAG: twin-arginine translocase TatA/TatE family subunit [Defluviitaleaceae bacterium]|nr:twin-arginine translocase TatA/TatE family subunit [Defluviitaleaceae bacterium]
MLQIGGGQFFLLLLIAFLIVGPKDLPKIAKAIGRAVRYVRDLITDVTTTLNLEDEAGSIKEVTGTVQQVVDVVRNPSNILAPVRKEIVEVDNEIRGAIKPNTLPTKNKAVDEVKTEIEGVEQEIKSAIPQAPTRPVKPKEPETVQNIE